MTRDELIALAEQSGMWHASATNGKGQLIYYTSVESLEAFVAALSATLAKADERGSAEPWTERTVQPHAWVGHIDNDQKHCAKCGQLRTHVNHTTARDGSEPGLREALTRVLPIFEKVSRDLVFTGDKAGQFIADMHTLKGAAIPEQRTERAEMPVLTDEMRAVICNEGCVYQNADELYEALCLAARASAAKETK